MPEYVSDLRRLRLSDHITTLLIRYGLNTVEKLVEAVRADRLMNWPNLWLSPDSILAVESALSEQGLCDAPPHSFLRDLGLSRRTEMILFRANIKTVSQLQQCSDEALLKVKGFGRTMLAEVRGHVPGAALPVKPAPTNPLRPPAPPPQSATGGRLKIPAIPLPVPAPLPDDHIALKQLGLGHRAYANLRRDGFQTVEQLARADDITLLSQRQIGLGALAEIRHCLATFDPAEVAPEPPSPSASPSPDPTSVLAELKQEIRLGRLHLEAHRHGIRISEVLLKPDLLNSTGTCLGWHRALAPRTIAEDIVALFATLPFPYVEAFGLKLGPPQMTLQAIGDRAQRTRERIRQRLQRAGRRLPHAMLIQPCLRIQTALALAHEMSIAFDYATWQAALHGLELIGTWRGTRLEPLTPVLSPLDLLIALANSTTSYFHSRFVAPEPLLAAVLPKRTGRKPAAA